MYMYIHVYTHTHIYIGYKEVTYICQITLSQETCKSQYLTEEGFKGFKQMFPTPVFFFFPRFKGI